MGKQTPPKKKKKPAQTPYIRVSRRKIVEWLLAFFVVCGCMFILGVLVGRNTAPVHFDVDNIENKLANIQESVLKQRENLKQTIKDCLPKIEEIDVIDKLKEKGKRPEVYEQFIPPVKTPKYPKTAGLKDQPNQDKAGQKQQAKTAPYAAPLDAGIENKKNAAVGNETKKQKTPAGSKYTIQVAALRDLAKARTITDKFKKKGYPAYWQSSDIKGKKWFRVRIGPYPDRATVEKDSCRLREAGVKPVIFLLDR